MSLITTAGVWNNNDNDDENTETKKPTRRTSTQEQTRRQPPQQMYGPTVYPETNPQMNTILKKINDVNVKNAGENLMKFTPISPPEIQNKKEETTTNNTSGTSTTPPTTSKKYDATNLGDLYSNYKSSYSTPSTSPLANYAPVEGFTTTRSSKGGDNLMEKINYAIYLLEQQQGQKTDHVMEELVLYGLVGVFVIFVVDSFNRTSKYTR
jgi:hypothetical protein